MVKSQCEERGNKGQLRWECVCDCGNICIIHGENIRKGISKSCGCLRPPFVPANKNPDRELAVWTQIYNSTIKKRNKKWKIDGDVLLEEFIFMSKSPCYYCGLKNSNAWQDMRGGKRTSNTVVKYNGIDRLDSSCGYLKYNMVTCCKYCNAAKNIMSETEFVEFIKRVYKHMENNGKL